MKSVFVLLFTAGLIGCSSAPPPSPQVALRGQGSTLDQPAGATRCECNVTCTATGQGFVAFSAFGAQQACAKANRLCAEAGCTSCVQDGPAICE